MIDKLSILKTGCVLLLFISTVTLGQNDTATMGKSHSGYEFHYEDIANFKEVLKVMEAKGDTLQAIKDYFSRASEGMRAWIARYDVKPERIKKAVTYFPGYYKYLSGLEPQLRGYEAQIARGFDGLKELYPSDFVYIPPVYYFILFSGGGSVEMTANMISIDYFGWHDALDENEFDRIGGLFPKGKFPLVSVDLVPQVTIHETAHLLQAYIQGEMDYVSIYKGDNSTMQAYAVREGGADFIAYLGSGLIDEQKYAYGDQHEKELWEEFRNYLEDDVDDHPGWFSGKSEQLPQWPWQIGYYMGFKIVEHFYNTAQDKEEALLLILNSHRIEDFTKFISKYREKWD